jgi:transposase InsO family protein
VRATHSDEVWHIDTTVVRLLDGSRAYVHAVIDNFSRRILAWRVADVFAPVNSVAVLLDAGRRATGADPVPVVLADAGVENVNAHVDALIASGVLRRVLAYTELRFSNSMIEAWWRSFETPVAVPASARHRRDRPSTGRLLRRPAQPRAAPLGVSWTDAG